MPLSAKLPIPVAQPYFGDVEAVMAEIQKVLQTGRLMEGPYVERFEEAFRAVVGTPYAVSVNSCTTALEIILRHLDVRDREVVVPTNTFVATPNAVLYAGGRPVFAEISPDTFCLSADGLRKAITPRTRAVVLVHIAGLVTPELEAIQEICSRGQLALVEDCAHAHGSHKEGRHAGSFGAAGAFSFYPTKIITTGTGGMLTTHDRSLADFARSVRVHGRGRNPLEFERLGNDWFMDEVSAVMGYHPLARLEQTVGHRNGVAQRYRELLKDPELLTFPRVPEGSRHSYYKCPVLLHPSVNVPELKRRCLEEHGLELETLYSPPCHLQPVYRRMFGFREGAFPLAEGILKRQVCLPVHNGIGEREAAYVSEVLEEELRRVPHG